jgi:DNA-binding response OmpR family regulator
MPDQSSGSSPRTRQILLIDSDTAVTLTVEPYFNQQNYKLTVKATGAEGIAQAVSRPPSLILLSTRLPDASGVDIYKQLRARPRIASIPIMFLAETGDARLQNELLSAGADDFIPKPFDVDILTLRVRNAINRSERDGLNHPRSGLPTGRLLQERVRALADEDGWYKIDFSIDNFEAFRDQYGFMTGEEVVSFAGGVVSDVIQAFGAPDDFIGQKDDTSFVLISTLERGPQIKAALESRFNEGVQSFYGFMEREQGFMAVPDGNGGTVQKPLMSAKIKVQEGEAV